MGNYPAVFAAMFGRADLLQTILSSPGDCVDLGVEVKEDDLAWLAVKYPGGEAEVIIEVCQTALRGGEGGLEHQGHCRQHSPAVLPQAEHTGDSPASLLRDGKYPEMIARSVSLCYCYSCRLCVMCISIFVLCREMNQREILDLMRLQAKMSIVPGKKIVLPTPKLLGSLLYD